MWVRLQGVPCLDFVVCQDGEVEHPVFQEVYSKVSAYLLQNHVPLFRRESSLENKRHS